MSDALRLTSTVRTEFGKGAARRARRAALIPTVIYGHGEDPIHLNLPSREFAAVLRNHGTNAVLTLDVDGSEQLALVKTVVVHPIRNYIEHVDLLTVRRGEKVSVEVPVVLVGESAPQTIVYQDVTTIRLTADALSIPEEIEISIEGLEAGTQIVAGEVTLPAGAILDEEDDVLLVNIAEQMQIEEPTEEEEEEAAATPTEE